LARVFGITENISTTKGLKMFTQYAYELIDHKFPGIYNQAVMEFGALHCTPSNPSCTSCIFKEDCYAFAKNVVKDLPIKHVKKKAKNRYFYYFMFKLNDHKTGFEKLYLKKRISGDIWNNLYDFPLVELDKKVVLNDAVLVKMMKDEFGVVEPEIITVSKQYIHKLTHQTIHARFIIVNVYKKLLTSEKFVILSDKNKLNDFPVPRLIEQFFKDYKVL
jgi:A/G-specific adenine glycosylase